MLRGKDSGYPAETYAGTATGLCYDCTGAAPYEENYQLVSGARVWNHPPSCPSHRRDRETHYSFDDCKVCNKGATSQSNGIWGSSVVQCKACSDRHSAHPLVKKIHFLTSVESAKSALVHHVANRVWLERLEQRGIPTVFVKEGWTPEQKAVAQEVLGELKETLASLRNLDPIAWAAGYTPTPAEVKKVQGIYGYSLPPEITMRVISVPGRCGAHPTYAGKRAPIIRKGAFEVCPGCQRVYEDAHV